MHGAPQAYSDRVARRWTIRRFGAHAIGSCIDLVTFVTLLDLRNEKVKVGPFDIGVLGLLELRRVKLRDLLPLRREILAPRDEILELIPPGKIRLRNKTSHCPAALTAHLIGTTPALAALCCIYSILSRG
jgi:hypothetical protein